MGVLFISHSSKNNAEATKVRDWLKREGYGEIFLDLDPQHGLAPGERWQSELKKAGENCAAVIVLISPEWLKSDWCRTEFLVLRPDGRPHDGHYWDDYKFEAYGNEESRAEYSQRYADVLAESSKYTSTIHRSLDVGCGIGNFASWAVDRGLDAVGAEVDEEAIGAARARGLVVYELEEMASAIEPGSLDLITMWDVIEHLVDPATAVRDLVPLLRPGGLMVLETPDVAFPLRPMAIAVRKVAEPIRYSDVLYFADHRTYFSVAGLRHLLEAEGLDFMTDMAMRSPNAKMRSQFDHMSEGGRGLTMGRLYGPLDRSMNALRMTNKMIVIARRPWDAG